MSFVPATLLFSGLLAALTAVFAIGVPKYPDLWRSLPRNRVIGEILGIICLVWACFYLFPILQGALAVFKPIAQVLLPVVAVLAYFFLNFLFARALGGIILLSINYLLHQAFIAQVPVRPLYSLVCYFLVFFAMMLVGMPWSLRGLLARATGNVKWRYACSSCFLILTVFFASYALWG